MRQIAKVSGAIGSDGEYADDDEDYQHQHRRRQWRNVDVDVYIWRPAEWFDGTIEEILR